MGIFDKLTGRNKPEYKAALEARQAQLRAQGDALSARIKKESEAGRAAVEKQHAARIGALDRDIAQGKSQMEENRRQFSVDQVFRDLELEIKISLIRTLVRTDVPDPKAAMEAMRNDIQDKINLLKDDLSPEAISDVETWALSKAGKDEKAAGKVREAFRTLREKL